MKVLICPVSPEKTDGNVARVTGFFMASMVGGYLATNNILFIALIAVDFLIRSIPGAKFSPFSWIACLVTRLFNLKYKQINKGQKIFAARIGLVFSLTSIILFLFNPIASVTVAATLMFFALLGSLFNLCAGCILYSYLIYPFFEKRRYN